MINKKKKRIYQLSKELNCLNKNIIKIAIKLGINVKTHMSSINIEDYKKICNFFIKKKNKNILEYFKGINIIDISKKISKNVIKVKKEIFSNLNIKVTKKQSLDISIVKLIAEFYGFKIKKKKDISDISLFFKKKNFSYNNMKIRPPVVTIMGHVDHGKTTLLDVFRKSKITKCEFGGITQHIGAYQIKFNNQLITFLDTPGHSAFSAMRARGVKITDITILVVAADDGVMPQTIEAINHAKEANVPIIVAINKIDKINININNIKQELSKYDLISEEWGGKTIFVNISAKYNKNINNLIENILLIAEMEELKADPTYRAIGVVIEARLDKNKGPVATLLVQQGVLKIGVPIVVGNSFGRIRVMINDVGKHILKANISTPVEITGLNRVPKPGDYFVVFENEKIARQISNERYKKDLFKKHYFIKKKINSLEMFKKKLNINKVKIINFIIKADVQGSVEVLIINIKKLYAIYNKDIKIKIIYFSVGIINENDISLAISSKAIIIGFNVKLTLNAKKQIKLFKINVKLYNVIYNVIDDIEKYIKNIIYLKNSKKITGEMVVKEIYKIPNIGIIAGCYVKKGFINKKNLIKIYNNDKKVIYDGYIFSLKHFKLDINEVKTGFECGIMIKKNIKFEIGYIIKGFI